MQAPFAFNATTAAATLHLLIRNSDRYICPPFAQIFIPLLMFRVKSPVIVHIVGWLIFLMLPFLTMPGPEGSQKFIAILNSVNYWLSYSLYIFLFYFNAYFLIPKLYLRKKYLIYTVSALGLLVLIYFIKHWMEYP